MWQSDGRIAEGPDELFALREAVEIGRPRGRDDSDSGVLSEHCFLKTAIDCLDDCWSIAVLLFLGNNPAAARSRYGQAFRNGRARFS